VEEYVQIAFESKCICYLSAVLKEAGEVKQRAQASGFFWRHEGIPYLVTNRHCIVGRDGSNKPIGSFFPNALQVYFLEKGEKITENATFYRRRSIEIALWKDGYPDWLEHPLGAKIDIAAMPLDSPTLLSVDCVNDRKELSDWKAEAGVDCFIVGYPEKISGPEGTPIWKRASIASEPQLDYRDLPMFLCDSATRKGLSGSPVFGKAQGLLDSEGRRIDPYSDRLTFFGHWNVFLGIYAGREGNEQDGFQLGRVWRSSALSELLDAKKVATDPFAVSAPSPTQGRARPREGAPTSVLGALCLPKSHRISAGNRPHRALPGGGRARPGGAARLDSGLWWPIPPFG
jgi:hypothetical protein